MKYDSLFNIPKSEVSREQFIGDLRLWGKETDYGQDRIDLWLDSEEDWQVPVYWALNKGYKGEDNTYFEERDWPKPNFDYKHNQEEVVKRLLQNFENNHTGIIKAGMGFGKSLVCMDWARQMKTNVLIMCHKTDVLQAFEETANKLFGVECGYIVGKKEDTSKLITLSTRQTMVNRLKSDESLKRKFGAYCVDEAHRISSKSYIDIINALESRYRLMMTATLRRADKLNGVWDHHFGPVIATGKANFKPRMLYMPEMNLKTLNTKWLNYQGKIQTSKVHNSIADCSEYNGWIQSVCRDLTGRGRKILVICEYKSHIYNLKNLLPESGIYIGTDLDKKRIKKKELQDAIKCPIILATNKKIGDGTDTDRMMGDIDYIKPDTVMMVSPISDPEQQVGRIRDFEGMPDPLVIHPIITNHYYVKNQAVKSSKVYDNSEWLDFNYIKNLDNV